MKKASAKDAERLRSSEIKRTARRQPLIHRFRSRQRRQGGRQFFAELFRQNQMLHMNDPDLSLIHI